MEAIVTAATQLLEESGLESFTTNRIAQRAGVGVASVYRYFATKEAIIAEIDLRNRRENAAHMMSALRSFEEDFSAAARAALMHFLDTAGPRGRVRQALVSEVPLAWIKPNAAETFDGLIAACGLTLGRLLPELPKSEIERRLYLAFHAVQGVAVARLVFPLDTLELEIAVHLMERMILAIVLAPLAPTSRPT